MYNHVMEIIREETEIEEFSSASFDQYFGGLNVASLDIETTGLSPAGSSCILTGILKPGRGGGQLVQLFSDRGTPEDEKELLTAASEELRDVDVMVTYNGRSFDGPFMARRMERFGMDPRLPYDLDLLPILRKHSDLKSFLPNLRQKTVEDFMGLWDRRDDTVSGRDSVLIYYDFLTSGKEELKHSVLLHNHDDVLQLYRLLAALKKTDLHAALYDTGFPVKAGNTLLSVNSISVGRRTLDASGGQLSGELGAVQFADETGVSCEFSRINRKFEMHIDLLESGGVKFADIARAGIDTAEFEAYPAAGSGYVAVSEGKKIFYGQTNLMIKRILERMISEWTTEN
ncbi:MAG: ribonuclease H-like domain-containing protein [Anaerovoracaceae bacterium]